uniref:Uncharacterized protein n=1 Tax=Anguilla anguilla TaxID=7936 RepID=A0A0E9WMI3_ANGAN
MTGRMAIAELIAHRTLREGGGGCCWYEAANKRQPGTASGTLAPSPGQKGNCSLLNVMLCPLRFHTHPVEGTVLVSSLPPSSILSAQVQNEKQAL